MSVSRIYVEKKAEFAVEARAVLSDLQTALRLNVTNVRIFNRYDADHLTEEAFQRAIPTDAYSALNICRDSLTSVQTAANSASRSCCRANAAVSAPHRYSSSPAISPTQSSTV